jgi:hypothetical protein
VTPRASIGFHQAHYDKAFPFGIKVIDAMVGAEPVFVFRWVQLRLIKRDINIL